MHSLLKTVSRCLDLKSARVSQRLPAPSEKLSQLLDLEYHAATKPHAAGLLASLKDVTTMLNYELLRTEGILVIRPEASLEATDFQQIAKEVDPYIEASGKLHGLMIDARSFPGWKDFAALVAHLKFIKDHHRKIERIAAVTDSGFLSIAPKIASHFVQAEVKHFAHSQREEALDWLRTGS